MNEAGNRLVGYWLDMARSTLNDASLLHEGGGSRWSVVNRAYYAMFYAATALLVHRGQGSGKHSGVLALFDRHFIKTGLLPSEMSRALHKAFELRQIGDYRELVTLTEKQADDVLQNARDFVRQTEQFLTPQLPEH